MTKKATYTPGDQESGLAAVGENIELTVWSNNAGNVDIHDVEVYGDGERLFRHSLSRILLQSGVCSVYMEKINVISAN